MILRINKLNTLNILFKKAKHLRFLPEVVTPQVIVVPKRKSVNPINPSLTNYSLAFLDSSISQKNNLIQPNSPLQKLILNQLKKSKNNFIMLISKTNSNTSKKPTTKNLKVTSLILTNLGKEESEKKQIFKIDQEESNDTENN